MAPRRPRSDAGLLSTGEPEDFERFYLRHVDIVTAFTLARVRQREHALDVVSETFARALAKRRQYRPSKGPAIAWLLTIARNLLIDEARQGRVADDARRRLGVERVAVTDERIDALERHVSLAIDVALDGLPEAQRDAVRRRVLLDEDYAEIAHATGCSEVLVRQRVRRGLQSLRATIQEP
ncbi:MAG: RNA polymerase sigma factor [Solirubrobacteraceae bacterium]